MANILLVHADVTSVVSRWRTLTKVINSDLEGIVGQEGDELAVQILDNARDETLEELVELPVTTRADAAAVVEVVAHILRHDQRDDGLEARLLRKALNYLDSPEKADFAYLRQN